MTRHPTVMLLCVVLLAAVAAPRAFGVVPPDPDALAIIHVDDEGRRSPLLDPRRMPIYEDLGHGLRPEISIDRHGPLGYDLVLEFENTTESEVGLGRIEVGVITLGPEFEWLNLNRHCAFVETDRRSFSGQVRAYPGSFYSPVGVLRNDDFAVGVSLLYDVLQDRHGVTVRITKPGGVYASGPGGPGLAIGFDLGNDSTGKGRVVRPARLAPGESRTYRVAVRVVKLDRPASDRGAQHWLACIEPYRQHFEALYGGVTYVRDPRPVRQWPIAGQHEQSDTNPMGFGGGSNRPDRVGWGPTVRSLMQPAGFERTMLWNPGGLYRNNPELNFPCRFVSQLVTSSRLSTAFDDQIGLPRLAASGHQVGLWWGRSTRVARQWDIPEWQPIDLAHPDRVALAMHEMRIAADTGATAIGLDAFVHDEMPVWQQYEWILTLRRMYPHMTFITEPITCDVLHSLGPTFNIAWRGGDTTGRPETRYRLRTAHYLADYLLPGHEIWGQFRYDVSRIASNAARLQQDAEYIAATGQVALMASSRLTLPNAAAAAAAPTWIQTVPDALKTAAHHAANPPVLPIDGGNTDDAGTTNDDPGTSDRPEGEDGEAETRAFTLPNGRVIRLPIYSSSK